MLSSICEIDVTRAKAPVRGSLRGSSRPEHERMDLGGIDPVVLRAGIEAEVIPRLSHAFRDRLAKPGSGPVAGARRPSGCVIDRERVIRFAKLLRADDRAGCLTKIEGFRAEGLSLERIYLDLFAPAARHLHMQWVDDCCGLAESVLAFCLLKALLRHYASDFEAEGGRVENGRRILLVAPVSRGVDVDLAVFELLFFAAFFRRDGWSTRIELDRVGNGLGETVRGEWFDLVEVLTTSVTPSDAVASSIRAVRNSAKNRAVKVIVQGSLAADDLDALSCIAADGTAADPVSSVSQARCLMRAAPGRPVASKSKRLAGRLTSQERAPVQAGPCAPGWVGSPEALQMVSYLPFRIHSMRAAQRDRLS